MTQALDALTPTLAADPWRAIFARDAAFDGRFVFAVVTTGIYCRPSCPARHARRENMRLFTTCAEAEAAGFRACKRCRPQQATPDEQRAALVARACRAIATAEAPPSLAALAQQAEVSAHHFHRLFKSVTGVTPRAYALALRRTRLRASLEGDETITRALFNAGYQSSSRFYAEAPQTLGMTPREFRDGGAHRRIRVAFSECSLGLVLVAATDAGVCAVALGDEREALRADLRKRFPKAELLDADAGFETHVATVLGLIEHPRAASALPLDIRGTAFQLRVWRALRDVPAGSTASYAEIAQRIGAPKSARAVAGACAANPVAVVVPCHRVLHGDGTLSGYRWGVERKRALLAREKKS